ncbi:hypothetical protein F0L74_10700 [Chitinophaga agrisoli]|uniref:Uncharacterized protein n=1 Tax=Chitinophaga agrisoli TaxID=2607653 RepID=A0A5B2VXD8_9BACT|nr:hypothetical protein [Chitinophaga agrisoli]KAA2242982.1 hypothetical protein F0L74_10700 [Chitinophaga agrisoli]
MNIVQKRLRRLSRLTKALLAAGLLLIIYGYLCRSLRLYFFWESRAIGWDFFCMGIIMLLTDLIRVKSVLQKHTLPEKIGIGIISFILLAQAIFLVLLPFTDAYITARDYLPESPELCEEVGDISSFSLMPAGGIQQTADSSGQYGNAAISLIVKGEKKFADITIFVAKYPDSTAWKVEGID